MASNAAYLREFLEFAEQRPDKNTAIQDFIAMTRGSAQSQNINNNSTNIASSSHTNVTSESICNSNNTPDPESVKHMESSPQPFHDPKIEKHNESSPQPFVPQALPVSNNPSNAIPPTSLSNEFSNQESDLNQPNSPANDEWLVVDDTDELQVTETSTSPFVCPMKALNSNHFTTISNESIAEDTTENLSNSISKTKDLETENKDNSDVTESLQINQTLIDKYPSLSKRAVIKLKPLSTSKIERYTNRSKLKKKSTNHHHHDKDHKQPKKRRLVILDSDNESDSNIDKNSKHRIKPKIATSQMTDNARNDIKIKEKKKLKNHTSTTSLEEKKQKETKIRKLSSCKDTVPTPSGTYKKPIGEEKRMKKIPKIPLQERLARDRQNDMMMSSKAMDDWLDKKLNGNKAVKQLSNEIRGNGLVKYYKKGLLEKERASQSFQLGSFILNLKLKVEKGEDIFTLPDGVVDESKNLDKIATENKRKGFDRDRGRMQKSRPHSAERLRSPSTHSSRGMKRSPSRQRLLPKRRISKDNQRHEKDGSYTRRYSSTLSSSRKPAYADSKHEHARSPLGDLRRASDERSSDSPRSRQSSLDSRSSKSHRPISPMKHHNSPTVKDRSSLSHDRAHKYKNVDREKSRHQNSSKYAAAKSRDIQPQRRSIDPRNKDRKDRHNERSDDGNRRDNETLRRLEVERRRREFERKHEGSNKRKNNAQTDTHLSIDKKLQENSSSYHSSYNSIPAHKRPKLEGPSRVRDDKLLKDPDFKDNVLNVHKLKHNKRDPQDWINRKLGGGK